MKTIKVVVLGDNSIGKTWLVTTFITGKNPGGYTPTLFDNLGKRVEFKKKVYMVSVWDTAGNDEFTRMRSLSFIQADVFLLCYSMNNVRSFNSIQKWLDGLKDFECPIILCGTKCDLKDEEIIDPDVADEIATKNGLYAHIETSSVDYINVNAAFDKAIEAVVSPKNGRNGYISCCGLFTCC
ncbi:Rac-like GTP-binding protein ARAC7 [Nosema bombycis CQ1]|uniref:Rac-like GTP-binding protein ARAC7 n=1 Tax=Nosema bombycis (strain CQ1 / CVCC 102059) TaxID=578461 RepID=R0MDL4_NOSB1|nr:Rac-like GTP-binding protein ARAC7 [Nosema bombycis CQ1]|eukprot:EOB12170.1 Rac-like GTP-binding protein ARAC7 [Nosema bombycis CQ1]